MDTYTLVAYKPNSDDYCRGYHMESYCSSFVFKKDLSLEKLCRELVDVVHTNKTLDTGETGFEEIAILRNTVETPEWLEPDCQLYRQILSWATDHADERIRAEKEEKRQNAVKEKQAVIDRQADREKTELQRLKAKYPTS